MNDGHKELHGGGGGRRGVQGRRMGWKEDNGNDGLEEMTGGRIGSKGGERKVGGHEGRKDIMKEERKEGRDGAMAGGRGAMIGEERNTGRLWCCL